MTGVLPAHVMCDPRTGSVVTPAPGHSGNLHLRPLSGGRRLLGEDLRSWRTWRSALELIHECGCGEGCPSCGLSRPLEPQGADIDTRGRYPTKAALCILRSASAGLRTKPPGEMYARRLAQAPAGSDRGRGCSGDSPTPLGSSPPGQSRPSCGDASGSHAEASRRALRRRTTDDSCLNFRRLRRSARTCADWC